MTEELKFPGFPGYCYQCRKEFIIARTENDRNSPDFGKKSCPYCNNKDIAWSPKTNELVEKYNQAILRRITAKTPPNSNQN